MNNDLDIIVKTYPVEQNVLHVYAIGDVHVGSPQFNEKAIKKKIDIIKNDDVGCLCLLGDLGDFALRNSKSNIYQATMQPKEQTDYIYDLFYDVRDRIVYYATTAAVTAGNRPSVSYMYSQYYTITLGYSFNRTGAALTLTSWKPVYIKCSPQTDGSAIIDPDNPFVQAKPTTNDGYIYIFLGVATSATAIEMTLEHPIYYHDGTALRRWTGPVS